MPQDLLLNLARTLKVALLFLSPIVVFLVVRHRLRKSGVPGATREAGKAAKTQVFNVLKIIVIIVCAVIVIVYPALLILAGFMILAFFLGGGSGGGYHGRMTDGGDF